MAIVWKYTPPTVNAIAVLQAAIPAATRAAAEHLLAVSQPLVPIDTGELQASGKVTQDGDDAHVSYSAVAEDGYDYAAIQHERLDYHHEHGQAKYLEQPMSSERPTIAEVMATTIRGALGL